MKKNILKLMVVFFLINLNVTFGQTAQISEKQESLKTYPFYDPNPIPEFGKIYPYYRFDGYSSVGEGKEWKMVEMENQYIKLWIVPEIGGKIWGAVEKSTGKEFIYYNHVVKFRDVAMRGPWTSGGIEMNFGVIGHAPTCSTPVDYYVRTNEDGSASCFVGATDLASHTRWSVEINLPKDKAYFTTRSVWDNSTLQEQSYYHWMNLGVKTAGNLEYVFPGSYHLEHNGQSFSWPVDEQGREINFYENNNFGSYKSYHVFGEATGFYGAYWHDDDFGFVHYSSYDDKPGKKVWIWGLSDQGMIWEKLLTDQDGQYTELQSGRLFNQAIEESSLTPFKHRGFLPGSTDEFTEYWFPVKGTDGLKAALVEGSVNLQQKGETCKVWFCPNEKAEGKLEVRDRGKIIYAKGINLSPMEPETGMFQYQGDAKELSIWLDNELLYDASREKYRIKRPVEALSGFDWETAYGHYLKGKEQERQRLYKAAGEEYRKSLEKEAYFVPALTGAGSIAYRKMDYQTAFEYALKALSVDTYDAEANMIYGLSGLALGDTVSATDGFSIAAASVSFRVPAYNALASVYMNRNDYQKSLFCAEKSLIYNQIGVDAVQQKILSLRKLGRKQEAFAALNELEKRNPLNHFIRFEKYFRDSNSENKVQVQKYVTNEFPEETYLEYALWYYRNGQSTDALKILELAPQEHPVVLLWEAYLNHRNGKEETASEMLAKALKRSPYLIFPFRAETLMPLEWAGTQSDDWKIKYYTGLIYLNTGAEEKGRNAWKECGNIPDFYPFYIARSHLLEDEDPQKQAEVERALAQGENEWRAGLYASQFYLNKGNTLKAEKVVKDYFEKDPKNYYLGLHYAKILEAEGKYSGCTGLLQKLEVLPSEGTTEGREIWRNANIGEALNLMKDKKYKKALGSIAKAKQWPENFGVGKPYDVDEQKEDSIRSECLKYLGQKTEEK